MAFCDAYIPVHFGWSSPVRPLAARWRSQHRPGRGGHRPRWLTAGCPYSRPPGSCSAGPCRSRRSSTVAPPWPPASALPAPPRDAVPGLRDLGRLLGGGGAAGRRRTGRTVAGDHHRPHLQRPGPDLAGAVGRPAGRPGRSTGCSTASGVTRGAGWRWSPRSGMGRRRAPTHSVQIGLAILWQMAVCSSRVCGRLGTEPCLTCRLWVEPPPESNRRPPPYHRCAEGSQHHAAPNVSARSRR